MDNSFDDMSMRARVSKETPYLKRAMMKPCFSALYWGTVVNMLASMATALTVHCALIQMGACILMGVMSFRIGRYDKKNAELYYVSAVGYLFYAVVTAISWFVGISYYLTPSVGMILSVIMIIGAIASFVGNICEAVAYARTMEDIDYTMAYKWKKYLKQLIGAIVFGVVLIVAIFATGLRGMLTGMAMGASAGVGMIVLLIGTLVWSVFAIVVGIKKPVYLYKTSNIL
ncbi:MAG: hypothetical protein E7290_12005 [Lachnospiraceae bacterium]|nr:hypothetical protein [Lachnospiraceae bacterium]